MDSSSSSDSSESDDMVALLGDPGLFGGNKRNRTCTDKGYIYGMAVFFSILFGFLGYYMATGDLDRIINGYDDCGNVCGKNNIKTDSIPFECFGKNMEQKKYLLYGYETSEDGLKKNVTKTCVENCNDHDADVEFLNRCFPNTLKKNETVTTDNVYQSLAEDFQICWKHIILLSFLALVFSIIMMVLMRYATAFFVWFVLISLSMLLIGFTTYLWIRFYEANNENNHEEFASFLYFAILLTITTAIILLLATIVIEKNLIIQLYKESVKAIADMPLLLFQPILTFFVLFLIISMAFTTTLFVISSGYLDKSPENPRTLDYFVSTLDTFVTWYNFVAILLIIQFVFGCQHIIIAGCVATWFFSRDKKNLGSPILTSTMNLLKYHLGTVALGSPIITTIQVIRNIISYLISFFFCCYSKLENFFKYFLRYAYVITAIYGHSFCVSRKCARNLFVKNIFHITAINSIGDGVLFFAKLFVALLTVIIGFVIFRQNNDIQNLWFPLVIVGCISYFISHCFIAVFEMAIDTIFLCFCEDCAHNDGLSKPYFMSYNLMKFVERSNKKLNSYNWNYTEQTAWDNGPKRVLQDAQ